MENSIRQGLVMDNLGLIQAVCRRFLRDPEDSRDMAQEVAAKILAAREVYRGESLASTWVYAVVRNSCIERIRRRANERRRQGLYLEHLRAESGVHGAPAHAAIHVGKFLAGADPTTKKIISCYADLGMSQREIGDMLGVSRVAISRRLGRLRAKLEKGLGPGRPREAGLLH